MAFPSTVLSDEEAIQFLLNSAQPVRSIVALSGATTALTAVQMCGNIVQQSGSNGALSVATPSAASVVANFAAPFVGQMFNFDLMNTNNNTVTLTAGTGVTLSGTTAVPSNKTQMYRGVLTNVTAGTEAYTLVGLLFAPV